jgi:hypothetical protein
MELTDKNTETEKTNLGPTSPEGKFVLTLIPPLPGEIVDSINITISKPVDAKGTHQQVKTTAKLSIPRSDFATAQVGNHFFVAGGATSNNAPSDAIDVFYVDPNTGTLKDVSDHINIKLSIPCRNPTAIVLNQLDNSVLFAESENKKSLSDVIDKITATTKGLEAKSYREEHTFQTCEFQPIFQGHGTNRLSQISARKTPPTVDEITGRAMINDSDFTVFIEKYKSLTGLRPSTLKLLDALTIKLHNQNNYRGNSEPNPIVSLPLDDYMILCGLPPTKASKDKTRRIVKQDLEMLYHISLEWREKKGNKTKDFLDIRIIDVKGFRNGNILASFSKPMASYLTHAYIMQYPTSLFKLDERNPNSYALGRKLALHASINNNRRRGTDNTISVRSLLKSCPDMPSYEKVNSTDRQVERRIIKPFETALNTLKFITWEYCNSKGTPLTEEQLENFTYCTFEKLYIHYTIKNFPNRTPPSITKSNNTKT